MFPDQNSIIVFYFNVPLRFIITYEQFGLSINTNLVHCTGAGFEAN